MRALSINKFYQSICRHYLALLIIKIKTFINLQVVFYNAKKVIQNRFKKLKQTNYVFIWVLKFSLCLVMSHPSSQLSWPPCLSISQSDLLLLSCGFFILADLHGLVHDRALSFFGACFEALRVWVVKMAAICGSLFCASVNRWWTTTAVIGIITLVGSLVKELSVRCLARSS